MAVVLIVGGTGCVGEVTARWLLGRGVERVVCLSRSVVEGGLDGVEYVVGDVMEMESILRVLREFGVTHVLHTAAMRTSACVGDPVGAVRVNVEGTVNVLEAVRLYGGVERFVFMSTAAVYALPEDGGFVDEGAEVCGRNAYVATKLAAERMVECYARAYGVSATVLRPQVIYGPERDEGSTAGVSMAMAAAGRGERFSIPFGGEMCFHFSGDVGQFCGLALLEGVGEFRVYNLPGESLRVERICEVLNERAGEVLVDYLEVDYPFVRGLDDGAFRGDFGEVEVTSFLEVVAEGDFGSGKV